MSSSVYDVIRNLTKNTNGLNVPWIYEQLKNTSPFKGDNPSLKRGEGSGLSPRRGEKDYLKRGEGSGLSPLRGDNLYEALLDNVEIKGIIEPDWPLFLGRLRMYELKKRVSSTFVDATKLLKPIANEKYFDFVMSHADELNAIIRHERDWKFDIFEVEEFFKLHFARIIQEKSNSLTSTLSNTLIVDTPQYTFLRTAVYLWFPNMKMIKQTYNDLSLRNYTLDSPILFNAGLFRPQMLKYFNLTISDTIESITKSWKQCAMITTNSGEIGIDFTSLRHSDIRQYGYSNGVVSWSNMTINVLKTMNKGINGKGCGTAYLCDWHKDIGDFLKLCSKVNGTGILQYAICISDEFMRRVENDEMWTLFCPSKVPGLDSKWGLEFEMAYRQSEDRAKIRKMTHFRIIKARELWYQILQTQIKYDSPFIVYKDSYNRKSNQRNLGTIRTTGFRTNTVGYSDEGSTFCCDIATISLKSCLEFTHLPFDSTEILIEDRYPIFNFKKLKRLVICLVQTLNNVIDRNYYPENMPEAKYANVTCRPLGIGIMDLHDVFSHFNIKWDSEEAKQLNLDIIEHIYYSAISESISLSKKSGPYDTFRSGKSPTSQGLLQFDLWDSEDLEKEFENEYDGIPSISFDLLKEHMDLKSKNFYNWDKIKEDVIKYGIRNSLLIAIEFKKGLFPPSSYLYLDNTLKNPIYVVDRSLKEDLLDIGMWTDSVIKHIIENGGSVQKLSSIISENSRVKDIMKKYKTVYEFPQKLFLNMVLDRGRYVCHSEEIPYWSKNPSFKDLNDYLFYGWKSGVKTGMSGIYRK